MRCLAVNILLVNLLIAMFSRRFEHIQGATYVYWRLQYYRLLKEYQLRSWLPPPLSLLAYVSRIWRAWMQPPLLSAEFDSDDINELEQFQERQTERYVRL